MNYILKIRLYQLLQSLKHFRLCRRFTAKETRQLQFGLVMGALHTICHWGTFCRVRDVGARPEHTVTWS